MNIFTITLYTGMLAKVNLAYVKKDTLHCYLPRDISFRATDLTSYFLIT